MVSRMNDGTQTTAILGALFAGGLAAFLFGIGLFGWELHFRGGASQVAAIKVHDAARQRTLLQIRQGNRLVEFPAHSEDTHRLGSVNVLYNPELNAARYRSESDARLLGGPFFAALGSLFLLVGAVGWRDVSSDSDAADWTDYMLSFVGVAAVSTVGCGIFAWSKTGWSWGFSTVMYMLMMTGLALAGLVAITRGGRRIVAQRARLPDNAHKVVDRRVR